MRSTGYTHNETHKALERRAIKNERKTVCYGTKPAVNPIGQRFRLAAELSLAVTILCQGIARRLESWFLDQHSTEALISHRVGFLSEKKPVSVNHKV